MEFKKWQKIQQFHNIRKSISKLVDYKKTLGEEVPYPIVTYKGKVKLDGTNAAIRIVNNCVFAQSRSRIITPEDDNYGFATFVAKPEIQEWIQNDISTGSLDITIYGEWCGEGVQKRCSVSKVPRMFVIFAVEVGENRLVDPVDIGAFCNRSLPENVYILGWHGDDIIVDYSSEESIDSAVNTMCTAVAEVEKCDPWVKAVFGKEGLGEGIVYYPVGVENNKILPEDADLMFKAKGEEHKNVRQLKPVIKDPEVVANVAAFVEKFVTPDRCEQGITELGLSDPDVKDTGKFLKWIGNDVESESKDELEVAGLLWKTVAKEVAQKARTWFFERIAQ